MPKRHIRWIAAAALLLAAVCAVSVARPARAADPPPFSATGALRICTNCAQTGGNLARYGYVVLNAWDAHMIPGLKAANPGLKVLVYKNLTFAVDYSCSHGVDDAALPSGVGYCDADQHHPDWFLKDTSGQRIASANFPSAWTMDVGSPGYQDAWLANVSAEVKAEGWDGVYADDTNADMGWHLNGRTMAKYPTGDGWRAATRSMLARVGPALQAQGTLFIPNLAAPWSPGYDALAVWKDWLQFTSGAAQEYYSKWGYASSSWFTGGDWTFRQQFQIATEAAGKIFIGLTYAPHDDVRSMTWARANFLLNTQGGRSALMYENGDQEASDPYNDAWTADLGAPAAARYQAGAAWRRDFARGTVVVNPSTSPVTVQLGAIYSNSAGDNVTAVTLAPATAAVLTSTGVPASPPSSAPPPPPQLGLTGGHVRGGIRLTWTGAVTKTVEVVRNGTKITTTANDRVYVDKLDRHASGTFSYAICLPGTKTCSPAVAVNVTPTVSNGRRIAAHSSARRHG